MYSLILKRENGFTLLEVVFAAAILAIGIMGYSKIKASSRYSRVYSKQLSQAVQLSEGQMEDFVWRGYHDSLLAGVKDDTKSHQLSTTLSIGDFEFTGADWTVRQGCPSELTKLIKFTGQWGNSKQIELTQVQVRP